MSNPDKYQGSEQEIGRIDLGRFGHIEFRDDGHNDNDTRVFLTLTGPTGTSNEAAIGLSGPVTRHRRDLNDDGLERILKGLSFQSEDVEQPDWSPGGGVGFLCDDCGKQWATKRNQTPDADDDVCPECIDDWEGD